MFRLQYVLVQILPKGLFWEMISCEFYFGKRQNEPPKPLWFRGFSNRYLFRFEMLVAGRLEPNIARLCRLHSCGARNFLRLGAPMNFDRCASLRSLHPPPAAVATSLRKPVGRWWVKIFLITRKISVSRMGN